MIISRMISAVQTALGCHVDGLDGVETWTAVYRKIVGEPPTPEHDISLADARSEELIATLLPEVRPYARALVHAAAEHDITIIVTSGTRTYAEQEALFNQGRSTPGEIVTKAHAGHSNHNFGIAFDVTIFHGGNPVWESPLYKVVGALGMRLGLEWGGSWTSIDDEPHFELHPTWAKGMSESAMLAQLRERHENKTEIFT